MKRVTKTVKKSLASSNVATKQDIRELSSKIDRNQKALDQIDGVSKKMDNVVKILQDNEENLKNLGGLQHRLDTLDKIMVTVDKIAGSMQTYQQEQALNSNKLSNHEDRIEKVEKHLHIAPAA